MKPALAALCLAAAAAAIAAERPTETRGEWLAVQSVAKAIAANDCAHAVDVMNGGLAARYPEMFIVAGTMFEEGICVKASWERAQPLYLEGAKAGHPGGFHRLVAGLARRDPGTALWWAQEARTPLPASCVTPDDVHADAERYVAALKAWPPGRFAACVYTAGVIAAVAGDVRYPSVAEASSLRGKVRMVFVPAESRFEWTTEDVEALDMPGLHAAEALVDRNTREMKDSFRRSLDETGARALKRYVRPDGIDPAWRVKVDFVFDLR